MIESYDELNLSQDDSLEQVDAKLVEKLGITLSYLQNSLSEYMQKKSDSLAKEFVNIAPNGDYINILEDSESISNFLKSKASSPENFKLREIKLNATKNNLVSFEFSNAAIDNGDSCTGFAYVNFAGKLRHSFVKGELDD